MKILCDHMLIRLGRWLRAAGYDTIITEKSVSDAEIHSLAIRESRKIITRDKHFLEMKDLEKIIVWLESNSVNGCAAELSQKLNIDWLKRPLSRCMLCNHLLEKAVEEQLKDLPQDVLSRNREFFYCPTCKKVYWLGTHAERMLRQLNTWKRTPIVP